MGIKNQRTWLICSTFELGRWAFWNVVCFAFTAGSRRGRRLHHRNAKERLAPRSDSHGPQSNTGTDQQYNRDRRESNTCLLLAYFLWSLRSFLFFLLMSPRPHCRSLTLFFKTQRSIVCACANVFMAGQEAFSQAFRAKSSQQNFKQPHMLVGSVVSKSYTFFFF